MTGEDTSPMSVARLGERAANLLPVIAGGAAGRDRNGEARAPVLRRIAVERLCAIRVPVRCGGPGGSVRDAMRLAVDLAAADPSVAEALCPTFVFVEDLLAGGCGAEQDRGFARVLAGELVGAGDLVEPAASERRSPVPAFVRLYAAAVLAGIARNAMTDTVCFARHRLPAGGADEPRVRQAVGELSADAFAAEAAVLAGASAIDRAWRADLRPNLLTAAAVEVAQALCVAAHSALRAGERALDVAGGPAAAVEHGLDRHWRNARAVAARHPRAHWAAAVGGYRLGGVEAW